MSNPGAQFAISLSDETSGPARSAGAALGQLRSKIDADTKALRSMQSAMRLLKGGTSTNVAAFRELRARIVAQRDAIARSQAAYVSLGGTFTDTAEKGSALDQVWECVRGAHGPVGQLAGRFAALTNPIGAVVAIAAAGIGIFVAFATAVVGAAVALGRLALASADARRSEMLHLEGLTTLRSAYGIAAGSASELVSAIDRVSDSSALSRGEISGMAESLYRAGLRGGNLREALDGLSIAQSVQGDRGAARFRAMAVSIARTGGSVRRLADDYRARLGGIASRQALSLDRQMERLRESVGRIFGDIRIEGFLSSLHEVVSLFSQSTASGRALHQIVGLIFNPLFDSIGQGGPVVRRFFQGMIIEAQRITINFLLVRNAVRRAFGTGTTGAIGASTGALEAGRFALLGLAAAVAVVAIPLAALGLVAYSTWIRFQQLAETFNTFRTAAASWASAGSALVDGFVSGITGGATRIADAVRGIASTATSTLRSALGIHSPSRVFAGLGRQIPRGLAVGVDSESSGVGAATESMAGAAVSGGVAGARRSGGGASIALTIQPGAIVINGGGAQAGQEAARAFVDELASAFEGIGIEIGAPA